MTSVDSLPRYQTVFFLLEPHFIYIQQMGACPSVVIRIMSLVERRGIILLYKTT
jgi:hypothetical protein